MNSFEIPSAAIEPTRRALQYWSERWDWECPTLFGIQLEELESILHTWPSIPAGMEEKTLRAVVAAYRELLHGASAIPANAVQPAIGITYEQACNLLKELVLASRGNQ